MAHGRYTIVGKLADGGMAEIFLAVQHGAEGFKKPVALKRVLSAFSADPQFRNMFIDEAHISMTLSHGNIVQVLDVGVAGERMFLVLELVEGWDLARILERAQATGPEHPWPPSLALYVTAQICRGLSYAHAKRGPDGHALGIVHRDVSPNNVLISEQGEVKLADFGIAKAEKKREQTLAGVIKGKIGFMSPEQALGRPLDARADLFSTGAVMYLMLTGRRPFDAGSELESLMKAQRAEFPSPEELNPYLSRAATDIVTRAMRRDAAARYQSADDMLLDVERVLRGEYHSAGQTELKRWLAELAQRDGVAPIGRPPSPPPDGDDDARPLFVDQAGGDLSAGSSVELSDVQARATATSIDDRGQDWGTVPTAAIPTTAAPASPSGRGAAPSAAAESVTAAAHESASVSASASARMDATPVLNGDERASAVLAPTKSAFPSPPAAVGKRHPRRSRVGMGFLLGALCMLGAVFGIRWLAQWAGRERVSLPAWYRSVASEPVQAGADAGSDGGAVAVLAARTTDGPTPDGHATMPAPPTAAAVEPGDDHGPGGQAGTAADGGARRVNAASDLDEDEEHLVGRIVPDAATIIGEDDAEEDTGPTGIRKRRKAADVARSRARSDGKTERTEAGGTSGSQSGGGGAAKLAESSVPGEAAAEPKKLKNTAGGPRTPGKRAAPVEIRITTSPLGAVVRTKKQVLGRTPLAARFNPGNTYELTFVKSGYVTHSRRLAVSAGKTKSISVAMKKKPPPPAPPARRSFFGGR